MAGEPFIRPYRPTDRAAVERICFDTGYMGDPVGWMYADRDSFAHLFCRWYLDHHPDCAWVVDVGGDARGYLLGCPDVRGDAQVRHLRAYATRHVLGRGLFLRPGTAGWIWRSALDIARDRRALDTPVPLDRYPAELHIDLLGEVRGRGLGRALVSTWCDELRRRSVPGIHLGAYGENAAGIAFFSSMGFREVGDAVPMPGARATDGSRHTIRHLVRELD